MRALLFLCTLPLLLLGGCGDDEARVLFNQGLAALRAGDLVPAEVAVEKAAVRGGPEIAALRDFVLGCAAFIRCERAEIKVYGPTGGVAAIDTAIRHAERARDFWQSAAASRPDWPEARRNVERALLKLADLRNKKAEAESAPQKAPEPKPKPMSADPAGSPQDPGIDKRAANRPDPQLAELPPEQITKLLDRLGEKEREKNRVRRAEQQARRAQVEKDW